MREINFGIHWLNFTVHAPREAAFMIYDVLFKSTFGDLEELGHGGRGFKEIFRALLEFKIYVTPAHEIDHEYFHFEIPGQACELLEWRYFQGLESLLPNISYPLHYPDSLGLLGSGGGGGGVVGGSTFSGGGL